jgi:cell shape-determining protein MreC
MNATEGVWLSINDYSRFKRVSISTIRRHIKNNILKYKEENGKYFIYVHSTDRIKQREEDETLKVKFEIERLKSEIKALKEENNELKMLVDLYEKNNTSLTPPVIETPPDFSKFI